MEYKGKGISAAPSCESLIMQLLHLVTLTHTQHLRTRSYAHHMALGDFYDELNELTDSLAEAYQGRYGLMDLPEVPYKKETDPIMSIKTMRRYIDDNRMMMVQDSELQNILDEIVALMDKTLYKLEFLS